MLNPFIIWANCPSSAQSRIRSWLAPLCIIALVLALGLFGISREAPCREAGWVPIPGANAKTAPAKKRTAPVKSPKKAAQPAKKSETNARQPRPAGLTVYERQAPITDKEVSAFVEVLPRFRRWARENSEDAHPVLNSDGKPDFIFSPQAAKWVRNNGFEPDRFFCVMGKLAAGMVIVEEGNDYKGTRPADMPEVSQEELDLARRHLGELLAAGGPPPPINGD